MNLNSNQMEVLINNNIHIEPIHLILAYIGMLLHVLTKLQELNQDSKFSLTDYVRKNIFSLTASLVMIPVILILSSDTAMKEFLPINKLTAVLAGWQTQSIFKTIMSFAGRKAKITNNEED